MAPGSGGASTRTHSPPSPVAEITQALVPAIHSLRPAISIVAGRGLPGQPRRPGPSWCRSWALLPPIEGGGHRPGARVRLHLLEGHWQRDPPVGPLVERARHVRTLLDAQGI